MHSYSPNHAPSLDRRVRSVGFSLLLNLSPAMTAAAYTAQELELLEAFSRKGFEERDVAGLLHAEAEDELARPIDRRSFDALCKKIRRTSMRRRSTLPQLFAFGATATAA